MNSAELKQVADHLRMTAVDMVYRGKDGHPGLRYRPWYRLCRCSGRFPETERNLLYP